ncbi:putative abc multidrug protein [Botrytis fragariae]|uniref:Putative abc multidrug protein n=1 Tax=Botrytis fragariae TaxID=1964551 RepID=A0A8H6ENP5_9HELO|nr:putative abc multidrug protein [Botrytis fragariae]KAF5878883.1 putative abc multidrug protein [Botrytis fragariae]
MSSNASSLATINGFGPAKSVGFDFTPLFEDVILSILPSVILLLLLPIRIWMLRGQPRKVNSSFLHSNKLLFLGVFTIMQTAYLIMNATTSTLKTRATIPAAALLLVDALGLFALSHIEHLHSVRPSALINVWLLLTLPFDMARARSLWLVHANNPTAAVFTSALGVKIMVIIAEAVEKRHILLDRYRNTSPETTSGIYSRSFFWWLNTLMTTGFQRIIKNEDLYPIGEEMSSHYLYSRAKSTWDVSNQTGTCSLLWSTLKATRGAFALGIVPRLCTTGFKYAQPFLLERTVRFANDESQPDSIGWSLTGAFGLVFLGLAVFNGAYYHMAYRFNTAVRGSLVSLIYAKTVDLSITALDESVAVTLMANDTSAICEGFTNIHELWAVPIELGIAMYLLYRQLGLPFLAPFSIALLCTAGILLMANWMGNAQKIWIRGIQTRIDITTSMLGSMKAVKMLGFTDSLTTMVQSLRVKEVYLSQLFRRLLCGRVFLANSTGIIAPLVTFTVFVISANVTGRTLSTSTAYTSLSLIALLADPMNTLVRTIPQINSAVACFERIQSFMLSDARKDHRLPVVGPQSSDTTSDSSQGIELKDISPVLNPSAMIIAQNASFAWSQDARPVINDFSFTLACSQSLFIIGPVGCGKSTLLKGLLGETPSSKGFIYAKTARTAYVEQSPWIQNGTIQDNILGPSNFDSLWYDQVVRACALEHDIAVLPNGSATRVGSGGISLSGGQKQRLALARAVYAKNEFIILDDVFSGLDSETEEQVFKRLFGKQGLFQEMGSTIILVTHAIHRLAYSDYIIALDQSSQIIEQGTFDYLKTSGGYVENLETRHRSEDCDSEEIDTKETTQKQGPFTIVENDDLINEIADLSRQTGDASVYQYYFASIGWVPTGIFFFFVLIFGAASKLPEIALTYWTRAVAVEGNKANPYWLGIYGMLSAIALIGFVAGISHLTLYMVPKSAKVLHQRLLDSVMGAPLSFFTATDTGTTTNRFSQDMSMLDGDLPYSMVDLSLSIVQASMGAILMSLSAGYFAATIPVIGLTVWVLQKFYLRTSRQMRLLDLEAKSPLYSHFIETLSGLTTIRAFGWTENFREQNLALLDTSQKPYYLLFCIQRWLGLVLDLLVTALAVILMVLIVKLRNDISPGYVGLALLNVMTFNQSLTEIIKEWTLMETAVGAVSRLKNFAATTVSENLPSEVESVPENWPAFGAIEFKNVKASYTSTSVPVIHDLNLAIKPGEKIGLCGRSGSGKSSLIAALFRMLELHPGSSILIDGIDISTIPRQTVRARLNAVPQDPFFLRSTIRRNADPYSVHTDLQIISALEKVQLWSLVSSKGGLDAQLDTEFFSHGQRQLFCLARAILRGGRIIVLDEATSSVDSETDKLMQRVIREVFEGCTILAVAHRLDTIADFDRIVLLGKGEVVESGRFGELTEREGAFRELYDS